MIGEYERLKAWLERVIGPTASQSVSIEDSVVAVVEEDVDTPPEVVVPLDDIYDTLGFENAPWLIEIDEGERKVVKFPVGL